MNESFLETPQGRNLPVESSKGNAKTTRKTLHFLCFYNYGCTLSLNYITTVE